LFFQLCFSGVEKEEKNSTSCFSHFHLLLLLLLHLLRSIQSIQQGQQLWYHVVGTPQASDALVLSVPEHPDWSLGGTVDDAGDTLYVSISQGTSPANRLWAVDLAAVPRREAKEGGERGKGALDFAALDSKDGAGADKKKDRNKAPSPNLPLAKLVDDFDSSYDYLATRSSDGKDVFMTNANAPLYRLVVGDARSAVVAAAAKGNGNGKGSNGNSKKSAPFVPIKEWTDLVPQHPRDTLQFAKALKGDDALVLGYLQDVATVLKHGSLVDGLGGGGGGGKGKSGGNGTVVPLPPLGSVGDLSGDREDATLFFTYTSFTDPGTTYSYDTAGVAAAKEEKRKKSSKASSSSATTTKSVESSDKNSSPESPEQLPLSSAPDSALKVFRQTQVPDYDRSDYKTERVFATSKDGTKVPIFVTSLASAKFDGKRPTVLYGYGGFNIAVKPSFSVSRMLWIRSFNAAYASANMRGGEEKKRERSFFFLSFFPKSGRKLQAKTKTKNSFFSSSLPFPSHPPTHSFQAANTASPGATPGPEPSRSKRCSTTSRPQPSTSSPR
jgi:prolyl oligopeptidase